ncbi:hypothetical protein [Botrimarina sp.]|uniref:hypothetical protein n=1 Tax=Botrimarina sp. TaxID=2795802 RepID=UPI0032ED5CF4
MAGQQKRRPSPRPSSFIINGKNGPIEVPVMPYPWPEPGTFSWKMKEKGYPLLTPEIASITSLAPEHLEYMLGCRIVNYHRGGFRELHVPQYTSGLSADILRFALGSEWFERAVNAESASPITEYLWRPPNDHAAEARTRRRATVLAEGIFNLQSVPGLSYRTRLIAKNQSDLQSAIGEFECAGVLACLNRQFSFVEPTGRKGCDYDAHFLSPAGRQLCCEIKAKSTSSLPSPQTILNTLESARKQLPKERPSIIYLRVPEHWSKETDLEAWFLRATEKLFRQSNRVVAAVLAVETWTEIKDHSIWRTRLETYPYYNHRSRFFDEDVPQALEVWRTDREVEWFSLQNYVRESLPRLCQRVWPHIGL